MVGYRTISGVGKMKRFFLSLCSTLLFCLLVGGCSKSSIPVYPALENLPENHQFAWVVSNNDSQEAGVVERIKNGKNIQALIVLPSTADPSTPLLNPDEVKAYWNESELETVVYYKKRDLALLFIFPDLELMKENVQGTISVQLAFSGYSGSLPVGELKIDLSDVEFDVIDSGKRFCTIKNEEELPLEGVLVFGQRLQDLMRRTDAQGRVYLDAATRNTPGPHYVWKEGFWTTEFDPLIEPVGILVSKTKKNSERVELTVTDPDGEAIAPVLLYIDNQEYLYSDDHVEEITVRNFASTTVRVMSAGYNGETVQIEPGAKNISLQLKPVNSPTLP